MIENIMQGLSVEEYGGTAILTEYLEFNGKTTKEFDMFLIERDAPTPEEMEQHVTVPYRQGYIDFSSRNGERIYNGRTLTYVFQIFGVTYEQRKAKEFLITNWLMNSGESKLIDSHDIQYYYHAKCKSVTVEDDERLQTLILTITFVAQPFKISELYDGHDIWDEFDFELDYVQDTTVQLLPYLGMTYKRLKPGDVAHIAPFIYTSGSEIFSEADQLKGFTVESEIDNGTPDSTGSRYYYKFKEFPVTYQQAFILECMQPMEITLWNTGIHRVIPETTTTMTYGGYSTFAVEKDGKFYFKRKDQPFQNLFLEPGENKLKVYGYGALVDFKWHREVI